ncbi:MAG TPA: galactose oxidase early set domain-containing protein [Nevskiaceae bacterium]|nr:galactose oxidase early set domain-containing protein [Nevskiaceae bacterium]
MLGSMSTRPWTRVSLAALMLSLVAACSGTDAPTDATLAPKSIPVPEDVADAAAVEGGTASAGHDPAPDIARAKAALAANVETQGRFGPVFDWPTIPLHLTLMPNGKVLGFGAEPDLSYGTMHYAVWDPTKGIGAGSMTELLNETGTNIFCAGQTLYPNGDVFIAGGTRRITDENGTRGNNGIAALNFFRYRTSTLENETREMQYRRWYPSVMTTWDGNLLVVGGRDINGVAGPDPVEATYATTPELWIKGKGWRTLRGAREDTAFGSYFSNWYYPRAFLMPNGKFFIYTFAGYPYVLDPSRRGYVQQIQGSPTGRLPTSQLNLPTIQYLPHRLLSLGDGNRDTPTATKVDIRSDVPTYTPVQSPGDLRIWGSLTVQADGKVFLNGGSTLPNDLATAFYRSATWDPQSDTWTPGAVAERARLYHSASILLPDATILTAAGGSPGPQTNPNAEIYYPPYLFKQDGSGDFANRPSITSAPGTALTWDEPFQVGVSDNTTVSRVTFIRTGGVTHSLNADQFLTELPFEQNGNTVQLTTPKLAVDAPPGFYLLFVFDQHGVPSIARFIRLLDTGSGTPLPRLPEAGVQVVVHDGATIGFSPQLGTKSTCTRCRLNVDAPVIGNGDGRGTIRLQFPDGTVSTALTLRTFGALPANGWTKLRMSVYPTKSNARFRVGVGVEGGERAEVAVRDLVPGQWNVVNLDLDQFTGINQFDSITVRPTGLGGSPRFYLDNIRLQP